MRNIQNADQIAPLFYALAKQYDGKDIFYRAALNIACGTDPARRDAILADFDKHFPEWNDKVADLVWELRPKSVLPRLGKLLADAKLTGPQKARIVDILAASDDPAAGQTHARRCCSSDAAPEVKASALDNLRLFLPTKWKGLQGSDGAGGGRHRQLLAEDEDRGDRAATRRRRGRRRIASTRSRRSRRNEKAPLELRKEAIRTLGKLPDDKSGRRAHRRRQPGEPAVGRVRSGARRTASQGPEAAEARDDALSTSLDRAVNAGDRGTPELKAAAVSRPRGQPGRHHLAARHSRQEGELPKELVADAGRLLRNTPFQDLAQPGDARVPGGRQARTRRTCPPIGELAKRTGDADPRQGGVEREPRGRGAVR